MPDKETLDVDTQTSSEQISRKQTDEWSCANKMQDAEALMQCNTNSKVITSDNSNPVVVDNNNSKQITYFQGQVRTLTEGQVQR